MNFSSPVRCSDVVIHHTGYQDQALRGRKLQRDLRLLQLEHAEQPDHALTLFNLGTVYQELGKKAEALEMFRRSLDRSSPEDSIVRKLSWATPPARSPAGNNACRHRREHTSPA